MTKRQKFQNYSPSELRTAYQRAANEVQRFTTMHNGGKKLSEKEMEEARENLEDRDYLSGVVDTLDKGSRTAGLPFGDGSGSAALSPIDYAEIGRDFQAMLAAKAPLDFNLQHIGGFPVGQVDARLRNGRGVFRGAATGANESVPSEGGFAVSTDFENRLMEQIFADSPLLRMLQEIEISTNANGIKITYVDETSRVDGSRWGGIRGYWLAEAAAKTASQPKVRQVEWLLKKVAALVYLTDELLADAAAFGRFVFEAMAKELRFQIQDRVINGTGAGGPLGILQAPALVSVAKESGQAADSVLWENIKKMWSRFIGENPTWLINRDIVPELYSMAQAVGTGGTAVYVPGSQGGTAGAARAPLNTLMGAPVLEIEQAATLGDQGDIILVDPQAYGLARKSEMVQTATSIHVKFVEDETVLRAVARVDGNPIPNAPITPYKGAATRSPFVTLDERA